MSRPYRFLPALALSVLAVAVAACGGSGTTSRAPGPFPACNPGCGVPPHAQYVVVGDIGAEALLTYNLGTTNTLTTGNIAPTYDNHATSLKFPFFIFNDYQSNLWAANFGGASITWYAVNATGGTPTTKTISGANTTLGCPTGVYINPHGDVYVSDPCSSKGSSVLYFASATGSPASPPSGNVAPTAWIEGGNTTLSDPQGLTVDSNGNLWVIDAGTNSVDQFGSALSAGQNNVAPNGALTSTSLSTPLEIYVDSAQHLWVGEDGATVGVLEFNLATGTQTPLCTIAGSNTGISGGQVSVAVDNGGYVYIVNAATAQIGIFTKGQCGNVAPAYTIAGSKTDLVEPGAVIVYSVSNDQ